MKNITNLITVMLIALIILLSGCVEEESSVSPTSEDSTPTTLEQTVTSSDIRDKVGDIEVSDKPSEREFEIHDYYDDLLLEETKKLIEAENEGLNYKYANQEELENAVRTEVANKYSISEEELDKIYMKVWTYNEL